MKWRVLWIPRALKDMGALGTVEQRRVRKAVEWFAEESRGDAIRLQGITPAEYRLRVGKWRVRFRLDHETGTMFVLHVLRRDEAY